MDAAGRFSGGPLRARRPAAIQQGQCSVFHGQAGRCGGFPAPLDNAGGRDLPTDFETAESMPVPHLRGELLPPEQQTLRSDAVFEGIGLHTGRKARVVVRPAPADHGVVFVSGGHRIAAVAENVGDTTRCSGLVSDGATIFTVEHLLAALYALGVDNAEISIDGPELPAMDGSAYPFAEGILAAGIRQQGRPAREVSLRDIVWVSDKDRHVLAIPADRLTVIAAVDFSRPFAGAQTICYSLEGPQQGSEALAQIGAASSTVAALLPPLRQPALEGGTPLNVFLEELAPARTFCFEDWIAPLQAAGLGTGGSLDNTLVLFDDHTSTPMRFPDELARHKTLDLLGDLALIGCRLRACVVAIKAGHALHVAAASKVRRAIHDVGHPADQRITAASLPVSTD
jgi:UDP-3-O-[3-hydroxymyristoyl] N-acetylglucosamine deacetylase